MARRYAHEQDGWGLAKRGKAAKAVKIAETGDGVPVGTQRDLGIPYEPTTASINAFKAWLGKFKRVNQGDNPSISSLLAADLERLEREGHTTKEIAARHKRLSAFFGALGAKDVSQDLCRAYAKQQERDDYSPWTTHGDLTVLRSALRACFKAKLLDAPVHEYVWVPSQPKGRTRVLTPAEFWKWHDAATSQHVRLFLVIALLTAARHSAICELKWDHIDFETGIIDFTASMRGKSSIVDKGYQKHRARVAMSATLRAHLLAAKAIATSPSVIEYQGNQVASCHDGCRAARVAAGLSSDVTPHVLRHTAATWARESGLDANVVADMTGHKDMQVLESIYTHKSGATSQAAVDAVATKLGGRMRIVK